MQIILNDKEDAFTQNLLNQSSADQACYEFSKNQSYQNSNETFYRSKVSPRSFEGQISDWNSNPVVYLKEKQRTERLVLPKMKSNLKSRRNIEDLSFQLLKYERSSFNQNNEDINFPLSIPKQMTRVNSQKEKAKQTQLPKKINIKLQFPERYERFQLQNQQAMSLLPFNVSRNRQSEFRAGSFYTKRLTQGLIPSMNKCSNSSFPKKAMFKSQSEMVPYQQLKLNASRYQDQMRNNHITEEVDEKFIQQQRTQRQRRVKLRLDRRLPINFLSYSHRKQNIGRNQGMEDTERRTRKQAHIRGSSINSHQQKSDRMDKQIYGNRRLSECIFFNVSKKKRTNN